MDDFFKETLAGLRERALYRECVAYEPVDAVRARCADGRTRLVLCSNNYLGLTHHPAVIEAAVEAARRWGAGAGGSRLVTGSHPVFAELEREIAAFKGTEAALVFNTGYMANVGVTSAVAGKADVIFSDALNHASIIDGCRLSGAKIVVYPHADSLSLERLLADTPCEGRRLIVTDGVFSMDGDLAPLDRLVPLAREYGALLMVDDAHATGVLGGGRGTAAHFGLEGAVDIQMGTLSKALASEGAYVAASGALIEFLVNRARSFIFSTAMSPASAAAALAALRLVRDEPERVASLQARCRLARRLLAERGIAAGGGPTPILPLLVGGNAEALSASRALWEAGFIVSAIRPPTVPAGQSRLRLTVSAAHTEADISCAADALAGVLFKNRSS